MQSAYNETWNAYWHRQGAGYQNIVNQDAGSNCFQDNRNNDLSRTECTGYWWYGERTPYYGPAGNKTDNYVGFRPSFKIKEDII